MGEIKRVFFVILAFLIFFFGLASGASAKEGFVSVVIPLRGYDFWEGEENPGLVAQEEKKLIEKYSLKATFLIRPDFYLDENILGTKEFEGHELGIFFEVTPKLAERAEVFYPKGEKADANRFFLSGYSTDKRKILIDTAFGFFKEKFGYFPSSVGAWHIDSYSAGYMREKYGVTAVMLVADQYSTDRYRVWGSWWGIPYYPSRKNILVPAQNSKDKVDAVITQWALRDPVNGYGGGPASLYSVQPNDYTAPGIDLTTSYFGKLLDIYLGENGLSFGHVSLGIENELFQSHKKEFENQLLEVARRENEGKLKVISMKDFSAWYRENYKGLTPSAKIVAGDPLGGNKKATWIMTKDYRIGLTEEGGKTYLTDLRDYKSSYPEPFLFAPNNRADLWVETLGIVDAAVDPNSKVEVGSMSETEIISKFIPQKGIKFDLKGLWKAVILVGLLGLIYKMKDKINIEKKSFLLILLGSITWSLTMIKSGLIYSFGMGFWGPNGHDGVWHIALAESLARGSLNIPTFSGQILKNYHIGFDLILAILGKVTLIPISVLYFQIIPPLLAILIGVLTYRFVLSWKDSKRAAFWATFFVYFGGSFGWVVSLFKGQGIAGESMFWAQQGISTLINPPFALSLVLILVALTLLSQKRKLLLVTIIFGLLIEIKAYAGILVIGGLLVAGVFEYLRNKKTDIIKVFGGALALSLLLFLPLNRSSQGLVVFRPFWFLETMMGFSDRLGWERFYSAMTNYRLGNIWIKAIPAYLVALVIFWIGNMGTRIVKEVLLWKWMRNIRKLGWMEMFIASVTLAGGIIPMLFLQEGTPWNTIQFFYYSLFFSAILAGVAMDEMMGELNKAVGRLVGVAFVLITIPTTMGTLTQYLPARPPARISNEELGALNFLKNEPAGVVLTYPFDKTKAKEAEGNPPRPLYLYESAAYVSAFTNKDVFLEDEVNLDITGYNWKERRDQVEHFYQSKSVEEVRNFLKDNNISYIYWIRGQRAILGEDQLGIEKIFGDQEIELFRVD